MKNKLMILTVAFAAMSNSVSAENSRFYKNYWESQPRTFSTPFAPKVVAQPNNTIEKALISTTTPSVSSSGLTFKGPLNYKSADMRTMTQSMRDTFYHMLPYQNKLDKTAKEFGCNIGAIHANEAGTMVATRTPAAFKLLTGTPTPVAFMPAAARTASTAAVTLGAASVAPAVLTAAAMPALALATTGVGYYLLQFPESVLDEVVTSEVVKESNIDQAITSNAMGNDEVVTTEKSEQAEHYANIQAGVQSNIDSMNGLMFGAEGQPYPENKNNPSFLTIKREQLKNLGSSATSTVQAHPYISTGAGLTVAAGLGYLAYTKYVAKKAAAVKAAAAKVVAPAVKVVAAQQPAPVKKAKRKVSGRCGKRK